MIAIDELDEQHANVALDILNADGAWPVHTGAVPAGAKPPYAMVYPIVSWPDGTPAEALDGQARTCVTRWYVHNAGATDQAARSVAGRTRQLLLNVVPMIAGRSCGRIEQEASAPPVPDETTGVPVIDIAAVYKLTTEG